MVDGFNCWTVEKNYDTYPKEKWCDMDRVADYIIKQNYSPKTDIENLSIMLVLHLGVNAETQEYAEDPCFVPIYKEVPYKDSIIEIIDIENLHEFVQASGGLEEFDYYC